MASLEIFSGALPRGVAHRRAAVRAPSRRVRGCRLRSRRRRLSPRLRPPSPPPSRLLAPHFPRVYRACLLRALRAVRAVPVAGSVRCRVCVQTVTVLPRRCQRRAAVAVVAAIAAPPTEHGATHALSHCLTAAAAAAVVFGPRQPRANVGVACVPSSPPRPSHHAVTLPLYRCHAVTIHDVVVCNCDGRRVRPACAAGVARRHKVVSQRVVMLLSLVLLRWCCCC
jgi:hypothetical protein